MIKNVGSGARQPGFKPKSTRTQALEQNLTQELQLQKLAAATATITHTEILLIVHEIWWNSENKNLSRNFKSQDNLWAQKGRSQDIKIGSITP